MIRKMVSFSRSADDEPGAEEFSTTIAIKVSKFYTPMATSVIATDQHIVFSTPVK